MCRCTVNYFSLVTYKSVCSHTIEHKYLYLLCEIYNFVVFELQKFITLYPGHFGHVDKCWFLDLPCMGTLVINYDR